LKKHQYILDSLILSNGLKSITTNLQVLSNSRGLQNHDNDSSILLDAVQQSTNELPDSYMWLDQNGKLVWLSGGGSLNEVKNQKPDSFDFSLISQFQGIPTPHTTALLLWNKIARIRALLECIFPIQYSIVVI
jgi:hypothetical protein